MIAESWFGGRTQGSYCTEFVLRKATIGRSCEMLPVARSHRTLQQRAPARSSVAEIFARLEGDKRSSVAEIFARLEGDSAGGVEALQKFAASLPDDLPAAVFIDLHIGSGGS